MDLLTISGVSVGRGERQRIEIPVSMLPTETWLSIPVEVVRGARPGPRVWLSAAVHGDELNGVEIIRLVLERLDPQSLRGTVIAVPIVNVYGFIDQSRYLPDRRDLNRSFPGSPRGSLAARLAHLFMREVVSHCTHGIDMHTGSHHRTNLPQVRANLADAETRRCAEAFGAPVVMHAETRDGSLREAATQRGIHVLLYEAGEPLRFDAESIRVGVGGTLRVLAALKMRQTAPKPRRPPVEIGGTTWIRARNSGILRLEAALGETVAAKQRLGVISDAFGDDRHTITAPGAGLIIACTNNPLVHQGDAIIHLARPSEDSTSS
ncbi:MAG: succinylglutamate desuccinylase/aspartoacylase family protein [Planctomycetaceae bacterium]